MALEIFYPGLRGVIAGETNICSLDEGLLYRGYCIHDLTQDATFLEVAHLLLNEDLPNEEELADFRSVIIEESEVPPQILSALEALPFNVTPLDALRTGISLQAHFDPQPSDGPMYGGLSQSLRLIARAPMILSAWLRGRTQEPMLEPQLHLGYGANVLYLLTGREPPVLFERAFEAALIAAAEHEFNPSTFAARLVGSTGGDVYAAVNAALAVRSGDRHGGGDDRVLTTLEEVEGADRATAWAEAHSEAELTLPGFGHPVFRECDPRAAALETHCQELAAGCGFSEMEEIADAVERAVWEIRREPANLDWSFVRLMHYIGLPRDAITSVFALARMVGWCAHAMEQAETGQVIRPRARYRGVEARSYLPLAMR
jgi:citrate synthase